MAITLKSATITDLDGNSVGVMSNQVVEIVAKTGGQAEVTVDVNGENLQVINTENTASTGSVSLDSGSGDITDLTVDGVSIFDTSSAIADVGDLDLQAFNLAVAINAYTSSPNYTATVSGDTVTIIADKALAAGPNGDVVVSTTNGTLATTDSNMASGADVVAALVTAFTSIVTLTTDTGTRYLNALRILSMNPTSDANVTYMRYDSTGEFAEEINVSDSVANVIAAVNAL